MDLYEVMRTTFACREWTDEPVSDETLHRVLDNARFAPNGGKRQGQHIIKGKTHIGAEDQLLHQRVPQTGHHLRQVTIQVQIQIFQVQC